MNKEAVVTVAIGLVLGIALAAVFFLASSRKLPAARQTLSPVGAQKTVPAPAEQNPVLHWNLPEDNSVTSEKTASISGTATAGTKILIVGNSDEQSVTADKNNSFAASLKLEEGENRILLINWKDNDPVSQSRIVTLEI